LTSKVVKIKDKTREHNRRLHDLIEFYTITSHFTRFAFDLHDLLI